AWLLERRRGDVRDRRRPAALDEPTLYLGGTALGLGRRDAGGPARPLLHLLARRPALAGRRDGLPDRPLAGPAVAAGNPGDRRARNAARGARGAGPAQPRRQPRH